MIQAADRQPKGEVVIEDRYSKVRGRRLVVLLALVGAFIATLAAAPSASAGLFTDDLTVNLTGTGNGQVAFPDDSLTTVTCTRTDGVNNPATCSQSYVSFSGEDVTLVASAAAGSSFGGWSVNPATAIVGTSCGLQVSCTINTLGNVTVTATFTLAPNTFPLAVLKAGPGQGTVTSAPAGINCGTTCAANYTGGTVVTLTAVAAAGSTFGGWSGGGCSGTGTCMVTMNAAQTVTATFNTQTFQLTVTVTGPSQAGGVGSSPGGISCPTTCSASFASGTQVTLTAVAAQGFVFQGWNGAGCSGTGTCVVTMSQAQSVTATFASGAVQASIVSTSIRRTGPPGARRVLRVTVNAQEDLARIVLRIRRGGITIQSKRINGFDADTEVIRMNIRNGINAGRAQLQVTFRNEAGTQKVQTRGIRIPRLFF
jgi:Divergent InlB B-repeat domain